jgi:hypothetical protein
VDVRLESRSRTGTKSGRPAAKKAARVQSWEKLAAPLSERGRPERSTGAEIENRWDKEGGHPESKAARVRGS